ncbi:MAG: methyl-accepting chemotaxis protein [Clostridium sp.]|nr:methyl-accepting chemotaxis protein [Clostridium sp.]
MTIKTSIKNKLVTYFGTILIISLLISGLVSNDLCRSIIEANAMEHLEQLAGETADKVNIILDQKTNEMINLSKVPVFADQNTDIEVKIKALEYLNKVFDFRDIAFVDVEGNSYGANGQRRMVKGSRTFEEALGGKINFSEAMKLEDETILTISVPVIDEQGIVRGVVMGVENVESFSGLLEKAGVTGEYMLLDSTGNIVAHSDLTILNDQMPMNEMSQHEEFSEVYEVYQVMLAGEKGVRLCKRPETGDYNYISYAPVGIGWSIALVSYRDQVLSVLSTFNSRLIFITVVITAICLLLAYYVASSLAKKISEIANYLDIVASGDFERPFPENLLDLRDEMGDAARALSTMKSEIQEMLGTIKDCTDYMNDQMEDLTGDVKSALKSALSSEELKDLEEESREDVVQRLQLLNHINEMMTETKHSEKEEKNIKNE